MKDLLRHKGFTGSIEVSLQDNCIHGRILFIEDVVTYEAETPAQLQNEFEEAVEDYLATCEELGRTPNKPFSGSLNVRIGSRLHQNLAEYAAIHDTSINELIKQAVNEYVDNQGTTEVIHKHYHTVKFEEKYKFDMSRKPTCVRANTLTVVK